jgi:hypothetical protein
MAAREIKGARAPGYSRVALDTYGSLVEERNYWDAREVRFRPGAEGNR